MTDDLVKRADEALRDVTPGPWFYAFHDHKDGDQVEVISQTPERRVRQVHEHDLGYNDDVDVQIVANARFIASARELVPAMRDRIEADAKTIAELRLRRERDAVQLEDTHQMYVDANEARIDAEARIAKLEAENERLRRTVDAAVKLGRIIGFLGEDEELIEAFRQECGPELLARARAELGEKKG